MRLLLFLVFLFIPVAGQGRILLLAPSSKGFTQAMNALKANLSDMDTRYHDISEHANSVDIHDIMVQYHPNLIVLFDNKAIRAYRQYIVDYKVKETIPVVALMALQIEHALEFFPQHIGISYEIPAVTTISRLRTLLKNPIRKVGVVYRASMEDFFRDHRKLCEVEQIELIGYQITNEAHPGNELRKGLNHLARNSDIDALWILNDNLLLTPRLFQEVWSPFMRNHRIPGIVGIETLVQPKLQFATYAVLPDPEGLGAQAANLIYEIEENQWKIPRSRIEKPLSVIQVLNSSMAQKVAKPRPEANQLVDKVLK